MGRMVMVRMRNWGIVQFKYTKENRGCDKNAQPHSAEKDPAMSPSRAGAATKFDLSCTWHM